MGLFDDQMIDVLQHSVYAWLCDSQDLCDLSLGVPSLSQSVGGSDVSYPVEPFLASSADRFAFDGGEVKGHLVVDQIARLHVLLQQSLIRIVSVAACDN